MKQTKSRKKRVSKRTVIARQLRFARSSKNVFQGQPVFTIEHMHKLPLSAEFKRILRLNKSPLVLDLGCNNGGTIRDAKRYFPKLRFIGVDTKHFGAFWQGKEGLHKDVQFMVTHFHQLSKKIRAGSVDFAYSPLGIQQDSYPNDVFKQMHTILKPGGRFMFTFGPPGTFLTPLPPAKQLALIAALKKIGFKVKQYSPTAFGVTKI